MTPDASHPQHDHYSTSADPTTWWRAHYDEATEQVLSFFGEDGISFEGKTVADIGCGDGIIDLGVAVKGKPSAMVGFDLFDVDVETLRGWSGKFRDDPELPPNLHFARSEQTSIPVDDETFDYVISWSAFEHVADPVPVLRDIRRILKPDGALFIQVWPFYDTAHGPHLVDWFPDGWAHHRLSDDEMVAEVRRSGDQTLASEMIEVFRTLNKISADDLHAALREAGFRTVKLALQANAEHIPPYAAHLPFSRVAVSGIKLLAIADPNPAPPTPEPEPEVVEPAPEPEPEQPAPSHGAVAAVRRLLHSTDTWLARWDRTEADRS